MNRTTLTRRTVLVSGTVTFMVAVVFLWTGSCAATPDTLVNYDCSDTPDAPQYDFTTRTVGQGWWYSEGSLLHMITEIGYDDCVYFGNRRDYDPPGWLIPPDSVGSHFSIRCRIEPGSEDWRWSLSDGEYAVSTVIPNDNSFILNGGGGPDTFSVSVTAFHDYSYLLRDGHLSFWFDGEELYSGTPHPHADAKLQIGDGYCATPLIRGELIVDHVLLIGNPEGLTEVDVREMTASGTTRVEPCYPNPFNPATTIRYQLAKPGRVSLKVYNVQGQCLRTLVNHAQPTGEYRVLWDGRDDRAQLLPSGLYFCRLRCCEVVDMGKLILLR